MFSTQLGPFIFTLQTESMPFFEARDFSFGDNVVTIELMEDEKLSIEEVVRISRSKYACFPGAEESALQHILAVEGVEQHASLTLHSAGLSNDNGGILLLGRSGSGKSTTAEKLSPYFFTGNSDNNLLLFPRRNNEPFLFTSLPFYNKQKGAPRPMKQPAPVRAVFLLEKEFNHHSSVTAITDRDKMWRFLIDGQVQAPMLQPELFPQYNDMLSQFVDTVNFFLLKHNITDSAEYIYRRIIEVLYD